MVPPLTTTGPPAPRSYIEPGPWLAEWCASQPARSTTEKIKELARFAGCSPTTIHYAIRSERQLGLVYAAALVPQLQLPADQAAHLLGIFELPHLPPKLARARREQLLGAVADSTGARWGDSGALLEDGVSDAAIIAALAPCYAALEGDCPSLARLLRCAIPPITLAHVRASAQGHDQGTTLAPRLVKLAAPGATLQSALAHQGLLAFCDDALLRVPAKDRDYRSLVASTDEQGSAECREADRLLEASLVELGHEAELRPTDQLIAVLTQRFVAAGPFPAGASSGEARWRAGLQLPPLETPLQTLAPAGPLDMPPRPHPTGITWFPTWVRVWRSWARLADQPYSDAWLAQATGMSRSAIYDLTVGTTRFASHHVFPFLAPFGFEKDRAAQVALEGMAMVAAPDSPHRHTKLIAAVRAMGAERGVRNPATEAHFVQSNWYARAVYNLVDLGGFQPVPGWISRALKGRIDSKGAQEALEALGALGLLRQDANGRVIVVEPVVRVEGPHEAISQFELHHGLLRQYRAELDARDPDLALTAWLIGLPDRAIPRFERLLEEWRARIFAALGASQRRRDAGATLDRVIVVSRQCFPVFRVRTPKRRTQTLRPPQAGGPKGAR